MSTKNVTITVGGNVVAEAGFIKWIQGTGTTYTVSVNTNTDYITVTDDATTAANLLSISRGGTLYASAGLSTGANIIVWRAPFAATVTNVRGYRVGGSGATVNARRNNTDNHLASDLSLTSADTWLDGGTVQNTAYVAGDEMEIMVVSVAGSPTQVAVQIDLTRSV